MANKKLRVAIIGVGNCASSLVQPFSPNPTTPINLPTYFFKTHPKQFRDDVCREKVEVFIEGPGKE